MARWLYLMRHAQSAERQSGQHDKDRDLTGTGMKEAATIGHFLKKNNYDVDLIVSSAAKRAESTARLVHGILNLKTEIHVEESLYEASVRNLLELTCGLDDGFKNFSGANTFEVCSARCSCKPFICFDEGENILTVLICRLV